MPICAKASDGPWHTRPGVNEEEVDLSDYHDYQDAYRQLGRFLDEVYMRKRIHPSLGYLTPAEFESQWLAQKASPTELA